MPKGGELRFIQVQWLDWWVSWLRGGLKVTAISNHCVNFGSGHGLVSRHCEVQLFDHGRFLTSESEVMLFSPPSDVRSSHSVSKVLMSCPEISAKYFKSRAPKSACAREVPQQWLPEKLSAVSNRNRQTGDGCTSACNFVSGNDSPERQTRHPTPSLSYFGRSRPGE